MPEFRNTLHTESDQLTVGQKERAKATERLSEPLSTPRPRMSVDEIRELTAVFRTNLQPASAHDEDDIVIPFPLLTSGDASDELVLTFSPEVTDESVDPAWLLSPHLALFYSKADATPLPAHDMKRYVLESLRSHDAVFILNVRKNIGMPKAWLTALEALKE